MKRTGFPLTLVLAGVLLAACRPERIRTRPINPHTTAFAQAGVSLVVGEEWECQNINSGHSRYPPTLVSQFGKIRVVLLPPDRCDPELVADGLRTDFDLNPRVIRHSFRRQLFANDNGVRGFCISYLQRADDGGADSIVENAHYLVKNRAGRCVAINYVASAEGLDSYAVHWMVRTTMKLQ